MRNDVRPRRPGRFAPGVRTGGSHATSFESAAAGDTDGAIHCDRRTGDRVIGGHSRSPGGAMTSLTRRSFLRGAAAGALVVGWDPVSGSWTTAGQNRRSVDKTPDIDGVLLSDPQ